MIFSEHIDMEHLLANTHQDPDNHEHSNGQENSSTPRKPLFLMILIVIDSTFNVSPS